MGGIFLAKNVLGASIRFQIVIIVTVFMSLMLIFQGIAMGWFIRINNRFRYEYISAANESIAASLRTMGENIRSMAVYAASFESFKALYLPNRTSDFNTADIVSTAFHTVRFIANYYPIVFDVVVVGLNEVPFSYYTGYSYDFVQLMQPMYDFDDPLAVESRFFFFKGQDYFIYVTPISGEFSSLGVNTKIASCIFICNLEYICRLTDINAVDSLINFSVYNEEGMLITGGNKETADARPIEIKTYAESMGLVVMAVGRTGGLITGANETFRFMFAFLLLSILLIIILTILVIILLRIKIALPILDLVNSLRAGTISPLHTRLSQSRVEEIDNIVEGVNSLLDEIEEYTRKSMEANEKLYEMEIRKNETEIYALQSQINPHFLNNTLQCIRSIAISHRVTEIADISLAMSELFRYAMNYEEHVLVKDEIAIVRQYIVITKIRFRNRFDITFDVDPALNDCPMCRMIIQPLVENAVSHGISKREDNGHIKVAARLEGTIICFEVTDNGPGFGEERLAEIHKRLAYNFKENREHYKGKSFGLYNINRRLKLNYGEDSTLEIECKDGLTLVRIRFPNQNSKEIQTEQQ